MKILKASAHRFGDSVAISVSGETVYFSVHDARLLSHAINRIARSVERLKYQGGLTFTLSSEQARNVVIDRN